MKIVAVGSTNPTKVEAVRQVFQKNTIFVQGMSVSSGVSAQPMSDEETRKGAIHRARQCLERGASVGIGLEGGVMESDSGMLSVNWGALADREERLVTAAGARFPLPDGMAEEIRHGKELGDVMDALTKRQGVRTQEGAVGIFTNGLMTRNELYIHIVRLLAGQYKFLQKSS